MEVSARSKFLFMHEMLVLTDHIYDCFPLGSRSFASRFCVLLEGPRLATYFTRGVN